MFLTCLSKPAICHLYPADINQFWKRHEPIGMLTKLLGILSPYHYSTASVEMRQWRVPMRVSEHIGVA